MLLLAVSKYRKKIGVIYTRTPKKRSFQAIFHTTAELSRFSPAETGSEQLLTGAPCAKKMMRPVSDSGRVAVSGCSDPVKKYERDVVCWK